MGYDEANIFARILRHELPAQRVFETGKVLAFMDIMPRGDGHVLVIPKTPSRTLLDADPEDLAELIKAVQIVGRAVHTAFEADGLTVQQFNEAAGGQVVLHLHFHVIPRFSGVPLRPHTGEMEQPDRLAAFAERIRRALP